MMDIQKNIKFWLDSAEHDLTSAEYLFEGKHYDWCLFIGHLVLEKVLKAMYVKALKITPPKTHNLVLLAEKINLNLTNDQENFLFEVNSFNIEARYGDYKLGFYKKCTPEFTSENFNKIKNIYKWIIQQI